MNDQKAILVVTAMVNKENMNELKSYLDQIGPITGKFGGQPVAKYKTIEDITGEQSPDLISVMEFPSKEVIMEMVHSKDFTDMADSRARVFSKLNMMISE